MTGVIKVRLLKLGYGFISADSGEDYFFHVTDAPDFERLQKGDRVTFVSETTDRGPRARAVTLRAEELAS